MANRDEWVMADFQCLVDEASVADELVLVYHRIDEQLCLVFARPKLVHEKSGELAMA